jgi:SAM-dependent methyltransferase
MIFVVDPVSREFPAAQDESLTTNSTLADPSSITARPGHYYLAAALAQYINSRTDGPQQILDIGCGKGELSVLLKRSLGEGSSYLGLDPFLPYARTAAERGVDVLPTTLEAFVEEASDRVPFDVIVMDNVLEHMPDPGNAIDLAKTLMTPGGAVAIAVPNVHDVRRYLPGRFNDKYLWIPDTHINYFSLATLKRLVTEHGLVPSLLQAPVRGAPWANKLKWGSKNLLERWLNLPARGLYVLARLPSR